MHLLKGYYVNFVNSILHLFLKIPNKTKAYFINPESLNPFVIKIINSSKIIGKFWEVKNIVMPIIS